MISITSLQLLRFKKRDRFSLLETLDQDVQLLEKHNIMDYSLLFAIEKNPNFKGAQSSASRTVVSDENEENLKKSKSFRLYFC